MAAVSRTRQPARARRVAGRNGQRTNAQGEATREAILLAAEAMFAERGIEATPLRDIGTAAGQRNNVAVQYHFGDRATLLSAIVDYRVKLSDERRTAMFADLLDQGRPPEARELVATFVVPLAAHLEDGNHYLPFLSRYIVETGGYAGLEVHQGGGTVTTIRQLLRRQVPDCPERVFQERWIQTMTTTVHTLARYQKLMALGALPAPLDELVDDLVTCLTASLEASAPSGASAGHAASDVPA